MNEVIMDLDTFQTKANTFAAVTEIENLDIDNLPFLLNDYDEDFESQSQSVIQIVHDVEIHEIRDTTQEPDKQALNRTNENQDFMDSIEKLTETPLKMPTPTYISEMKPNDNYDSPVKSIKKPN